MSLEETLEGAEKRAQELLESTRKLQRQAAAAVKMIRTGDLKGLRKTLALLEETRRQTESGLDEVRRSWSWSEQQEEQYVASEAFAQELLEQGRKQGVGIYRQESVLACYPSLVRVLPRDRAVRVDKKSVREIRPSFASGCDSWPTRAPNARVRRAEVSRHMSAGRSLRGSTSPGHGTPGSHQHCPYGHHCLPIVGFVGVPIVGDIGHPPPFAREGGSQQRHGEGQHADGGDCESEGTTHVHHSSKGGRFTGLTAGGRSGAPRRRSGSNPERSTSVASTGPASRSHPCGRSCGLLAASLTLCRSSFSDHGGWGNGDEFNIRAVLGVAVLSQAVAARPSVRLPSGP